MIPTYDPTAHLDLVKFHGAREVSSLAWGLSLLSFKGLLQITEVSDFLIKFARNIDKVALTKHPIISWRGTVQQKLMLLLGFILHFCQVIINSTSWFPCILRSNY